MTTGAEFASITHKKLLGFEDFGARMLSYLQAGIADAVSRVFKEGSFEEVMPLSGPAANTVQIDLKTVLQDAIGHDGAGHVLDLDAEVRAVLFANVNTVVYEVGAGYVNKPSGIAINPRTGKPEYLKLVEGIGVEADPNSVTDNTTTITFDVDSLFEDTGGVSDHTGRTVRVFRKTPSDGALLESVAIEEATVFFGGGVNQITTTAIFGQTAVSTIASEYTVQLVGPVVRKDTADNRPSNQSNLFFVGTVTGNGGTPTAFNTSGQAIIQADAANQVVFTPFIGATPISWNITAIDVQAVVQEVVNDLSAVDDGTNGTRLIGVDRTEFTTSVIGAGDGGGAGTTGNPDIPVSSQDALKNLDRRAVAHRPYTAVLADGTARTIADFVGVDAIDKVNVIANGGRYLLHADGGTDYEFDASTGFGTSSNDPVVVGETSVGGHDGYPTVAVKDGATVDHVLRGRFKRLHFKSNDVTATKRGYQLGANASLGGLALDECGVDAGHAIFRGFDGNTINPQNAIYIRNTEFAPGSNAGPFETALSLSESLGDDCHIIFDNCTIRGPHSAATVATAVLEITGFSASNFSAITFRDCKVIHENDVDIPTVKINSIGTRCEVNFVRCALYGIADQNTAVLDITSSRVNVDDLRIQAPGGRALSGSSYGAWNDVWIYAAGPARSVAFTTNQVFTVTPTDGPLHINRLRVDIGLPAWATAPVAPYVEFGGSGGTRSGNAKYTVDGLEVAIVSAGLNGSAVGFWTRNTEDRQPVINDVLVDMDSASWNATTLVAAAKLVKLAIIEFVNSGDDVPLYATNVQIYNLRRDTTNEAAAVGIYNQGCYLKGVSVVMNTTGTADIQAALYTDDSGDAGGEHIGALVEDFVLTNSATDFLDAPIVMAGEGDKVVNADFTKSGIAAVPGGAIGLVKMTAAAGGGQQEVDGLYFGDTNSGPFETLVDLGAGQYNQLKNFRINAGTNNRTAAFVIGTGKGQRVAMCALRGEGASFATFVSLTGDVSSVHDNILLSVDATPPTVTNSGTGSVSPDNILAANQ